MDGVGIIGVGTIVGDGDTDILSIITTAGEIEIDQILPIYSVEEGVI